MLMYPCIGLSSPMYYFIFAHHVSTRSLITGEFYFPNAFNMFSYIQMNEILNWKLALSICITTNFGGFCL